jgi:hypothetical protein
MPICINSCIQHVSKYFQNIKNQGKNNVNNKKNELINNVNDNIIKLLFLFI